MIYDSYSETGVDTAHGLVAPEAELEASGGRSCVTPGNPYVLHCFPAFGARPTKQHQAHLKWIAAKIARSFRTSTPITKVRIVGHSSTWRGTSRKQLEHRAIKRAGNAGNELILLLDSGVAKRVRIVTDGRSDNEPWRGIAYSSTSVSQKSRRDRALNRRVEIFLRARRAPKKRPKPRPKPRSVPKTPIDAATAKLMVWAILGEKPSDSAWKRNLKIAKFAIEGLKAAVDGLVGSANPIGPGFILQVFRQFDTERQDRPFVVRGVAMGMAYALVDTAAGKKRSSDELRKPRGIPLNIRDGFSTGYQKMRRRIQTMKRENPRTLKVLLKAVSDAGGKASFVKHAFNALWAVLKRKKGVDPHEFPQSETMLRFCNFKYPRIKACCGHRPGCRLDL
ncbi:hypothetical protein [Pelagibius sp. Alg239-R121]|uniref:hypothetical protein n=1 Tax=Pelagibius sp. Alg239-R121 TaxID=2993448 RepID=UPI0024A7A04D|nr:hypothetical protein [Pelagibius sp. Alg239-R121]